jgi:adenosylcobinamide kinase/adenosylcobinamide-phosphate guanylyltransferase
MLDQSSMKSLILGGVKSGKSRYAEQLAISQLSGLRVDGAVADNTICLIATATVLDDEMAMRVKKHQVDRDSSWKTLEEPIELSKALGSAQEQHQVIVIDCLTLWLTNLLMLEDNALLEKELSGFESALITSRANIIMVSNETNMGIMPLGEITRQYCDRAGLLHQRLARVCDRVDLVVAGLPLSLKKNA